MELVFGSMPDAARFVVAFMLVLGLIGAGALLWRRLGVGPLSPVGPRGRQPRLAVIDAAPVDARRRLILIKRDNTEHLLMIGGPTDIVVESNIARTGTAAVSREPRPIPDTSRQSTSTDAPDWTLPLDPITRPSRANGELDGGLSEPPRSAKEAMVDSMRAVRSAPAPRRSPTPARNATTAEDERTGLTPPSSAEVSHRAVPESRRSPSAPELQRPEPTPEPSSQSKDATEPKRVAAAPPRAVQAEEHSLAEMAQRLEAALRRPTKPIESPPPAPVAARPPVRPEPAAGRKPAHADSANAAKTGVKLAEQVASPPPELKILSGTVKTEPPIESLEDEMAKMLGRSPAKS
jgi:flagellar biogenesis protein FliO